MLQRRHLLGGAAALPFASIGAPAIAQAPGDIQRIEDKIEAMKSAGIVVSDSPAGLGEALLKAIAG